MFFKTLLCPLALDKSIASALEGLKPSLTHSCLETSLAHAVLIYIWKYSAKQLKNEALSREISEKTFLLIEFSFTYLMNIAFLMSDFIKIVGDLFAFGHELVGIVRLIGPTY